MSGCPHYGPFRECGLTVVIQAGEVLHVNPCDMELQGADPDVTLCIVPTLQARDKARQAMPVRKKPPLLELAPRPERRRERRA